MVGTGQLLGPHGSCNLDVQMSKTTKNPLERIDFVSVIRRGVDLLLDRVKGRIMNRKLRDRADEFERRLEAGDAEILSDEEADRRFAAIRARLTKLRKRPAPK